MTDCPRCGREMVADQGVAFLCGPGAPGAVDLPVTWRCPDLGCRAAAAARRDTDALEAALASGLIVPDDTPEDERWIGDPS